MAEKISFEKALARLEEIAELLEDEEIGLEKSLKLYKEGVRLSALCYERLERAEGEIKIIEKNASGGFSDRDFSPQED